MKSEFNKSWNSSVQLRTQIKGAVAREVQERWKEVAKIVGSVY